MLNLDDQPKPLAYLYNQNLPNKLYEVGTIFAHKAIRRGDKLAQDYVADKPGTQLLVINGFDYQIIVDKHTVLETKLVAAMLQSMNSFSHWNQSKIDTLSHCFKVKRRNKGHLVIEKGNEIENIILVRKGRLRLVKSLTFTNSNIHPAKKNNAREQHKAVNDEELTVLTVGPGTLIGPNEIKVNEAFQEGNLIVDEDETILCYCSPKSFLQQISELELSKLVKSDDCMQAPQEEEILVRRKGLHEMKQLRSNFLLDAVGKN